MTRQKVDIDDRILSYLEAGAGELVVLVHAFPLCAEMWEPQLASPPPGWRLIAPDLRGFGESPPDRTTRGPSSIDDYAADVMVLLTYLETSSAVIMGLSMGGYVAFGMLRAAPHRVRALVLADTRVGADSEEAKLGRRQMQALAEREGAPGVAQALLPKLLGEDTLREQPQVVARVREMAEAAPRVAIATALECLMTRPDSTLELVGFRGPALIIRGAQDALIPAAEAERMRNLIPGAASIEIPSSGHLPNLEQPEAFNRAWHAFLASRL